MALVNASNNASCPQWYLDASRTLHFITDQVMSPAYLVLGVLLHAITLKAYCTELKKEKGYLYQVFLTAGRTLAAFFSPLYIFNYNLANSNSPGAMWFRSSYWCMWMSAKIFLPCMGASTVTVHMYSLLVAVDRMFALWKPVSYRVTYENRNNALILFILPFISIAMISSNGLRFNILQTNSTTNTVLYERVPNFEFMTSRFGHVWLNLQTVLEGSVLIGLYVSNCAVVWLYRKSKLKAKNILNESSEMKKREEIEKLLTLLAISQSTCFTVVITYSAFTTFLAAYPSYHMCGMNLNTGLLSFVIMVLDFFDFAFVFAVQKNFRRMILETVKCCSKSKVETSPVVKIDIRQRGKGNLGAQNP